MTKVDHRWYKTVLFPVVFSAVAGPPPPRENTPTIAGGAFPSAPCPSSMRSPFPPFASGSERTCPEYRCSIVAPCPPPPPARWRRPTETVEGRDCWPQARWQCLHWLCRAGIAYALSKADLDFHEPGLLGTSPCFASCFVWLWVACQGLSVPIFKMD